MPSTPTDRCAPEWGEPACWQLPLAQLCDSALPTGAFSHSFGLETYICEGVVGDEASFVSWLYALTAPPAAVTAAYLQSSVISLTQNAVRAIPLGQDAGQRAIASVRDDVRAAVRRIGGLDEMDLGAAAPGIEISQMRHERQRTRMFMS